MKMRLLILFAVCSLTFCLDCNNKLISVYDYEEKMESIFRSGIASFINSGSTKEDTLIDNEEAYSRYKILPDVLNNVEKRNLSTKILGCPMSFPVGIAPMTGIGVVNKYGDLHTAIAAEAAGTVMILSTHSSDSIEDVAASTPNASRWFQLYVQKDEQVTKSLVQRAEKAGYKALVVTVDVPVPGINWQNKYNGFEWPDYVRMANFNFNGTNGLDELTYARSLIDSSVTWNIIQGLNSITNLPIVIKGILTAKSAKKAKDMGADAIIVSNHGGRALDGTPASIDALSDIVEAVGEDFPVFLDGGIRTGSDVFKALALGAHAVFIGKPAAWGVAYDGSSGVECVLNILKNELDNAMAMAGSPDLASIKWLI